MTLPDPRDAERPREGWKAAWLTHYAKPAAGTDPLLVSMRRIGFQDGWEARDAEVARLREALTGVLADIEDYERVNKLSPNPGRSDCWDSVKRARQALGPSDDH